MFLACLVGWWGGSFLFLSLQDPQVSSGVFPAWVQEKQKLLPLESHVLFIVEWSIENKIWKLNMLPANGGLWKFLFLILSVEKPRKVCVYSLGLHTWLQLHVHLFCVCMLSWAWLHYVTFHIIPMLCGASRLPSLLICNFPLQQWEMWFPQSKIHLLACWTPVQWEKKIQIY